MSHRDKVRLEARWRKARKDPHDTAESCWRIQHPQGSRLFKLREPQTEALKRWADGENSITLKARQIGWSTLIGFFSWHLAFFNPETRIIILSKGEREAAELLDKVFFGLDRLPEWLQARGPKVTKRNTSQVRFDNGSEILSLPSGNNPARGFTGRLVVVDEWAFLPNPEEAWASIEPVADIGGQIIGLSTANGAGNLFHELWQEAEKGSSTFKPMFFSWRAVPERDDAWYAKKVADNSARPWVVHQEYPDNPREAFIKSGAMVYSADLLGQYESHVTDPIARGDLWHNNPETPKSFSWQPNPQGYLSIWRFPEEGHKYVCGADVAEGLGHGDYSSAHVLDVNTGSVVAEWHGHIEADLFGLELLKLGLWYNTALLFPEVNNHGLTTMTELRRWSYPRLWRRKQLNSANGGYTMEFGWKTTRVTKPLLIDELGQWLRDHVDIHGSMPSAPTLSELTTFVRDDRGGMNGSPHDDKVISFGLAVQATKYAFMAEYAEVERAPEGSHAWWDEFFDQLEAEAAMDSEWVIG